MRDPTDLSGAEQEQEAHAAEAQRIALQQAEDIKWLLAHEAGRRIAWRMLEQTGAFRNPFNHSGSVTAFNCGQMNVGQWLLSEITTHRPEAYLKMLQEHRKNDD